MKIGTDAVLLGAWCTVADFPDTILDIGSGTGVVALMLAQRSDAMTVDAVEIDEAAFEQSVANFEQSDWADRLFCYHSSFEEFAKEMSEEEETYDVIVNNPPFYEAAYETKDAARNKARFTSSMSFESLIAGASKILAKNGTFTVIIPLKAEQDFVTLAHRHHLFLNRVCHIKGTPTTEVKRSLLSFSFQEKELISEELTIEVGRHQYTRDYIDLTKDFYLKM
ncbi:MAG: methyltransferase [Flavobacteriaceae bacterium]|nr:methyltransferase [Flavobacteriaceae bacterium]